MAERKVGRPTDYTPELAAAICDRIALGHKIIDICKEHGMPHRASVYLWLGKHQEFSDMYVRAREQRAELYAEEIVDIADNEADPNKARVRIDARKWAAAKLNQKVYGDKVTLDGNLRTQIDDSQLESRLAVLFRKAGIAVPAGGEGEAEGST